MALIVVWALSYFVFPEPDTWQLVINTITTIITFLLVTRLQNSQRRGEAAIQAKLDALADGLAELMEYHLEHHDVDLKGDVDDLKEAIGLEQVGGSEGVRSRSTPSQHEAPWHGISRHDVSDQRTAGLG